DVARDAAALHAVYGDTQSCTYLSHEAFDSVAETRVQLETWTAGLEALSWAVIDPPDGEALGRVALVPVRPEVFEVAVMLVPAAMERGRIAGHIKRPKGTHDGSIAVKGRGVA
ncbi:MAG: hypothetical protein AAFX94_09320, partial [Myxococcota bacterium]